MGVDEAARELARRQYEFPDVRDVFPIRGTGNDRVALLVVSYMTEPAGVMPLGFNRPPGFPYPYSIVEITPAEYEQLNNGELRMPDGWQIGERIPF